MLQLTRNLKHTSRLPVREVRSKPLSNSLTITPKRQRARNDATDSPHLQRAAPATQAACRLSPATPMKKFNQHKRTHQSRSRDSSFLSIPFTTMVPTPSRRDVKRIKRGRHAHFNKLLFCIDDPSSLPGRKQRNRHMSLTSTAGWRHGKSLSPSGSRLPPKLQWSW